MTAEIVVMNTQAVALAADSAVTVGADKVFTSANKLFALSKYEPVGIMVYQNASFMGIPWETLIKVFRKQLGQQVFPRLQDYADRFIDFLAHNPWFDESSQRRHCANLLWGFLNAIQVEIREGIGAILHKEGSITESQVADVVSSTIRRYFERWSQMDAAPSVENPDEAVSNILQKYEQEIEDSIRECFHTLPLADERRADLRLLSAYLFIKNCFSEEHSGIVIAGFGENDAYPSSVAYALEGLVAGVLKRSGANVCAADESENPAAVQSFAQGEMVQTFMNGIHPEQLTHIEQCASTIFDSVAARIGECLRESGVDPETIGKTEISVRQTQKAVLEEFRKNVRTFQVEHHIAPVIQIVMSLPKDELAKMAEALVNLTLFRRKVTPVPETVAGAIDVAVITKGDGFVWIQRKHYFRPELNHHFFANYFRKGGTADA